MILKNTKVELVDKASRFVLKRTLLGETELMNRKHAVTNQIFSYERKRLKEDKGLFPNASYQTHHIFHDKRFGWDYSELEMARSHADKSKRLFIPFEQRNYKQWKALTWGEAETSFINLANRGLQVVPYPLPLSATLEEWEWRKGIVMKKKLPSQEIMPVLSSRHNEDSFHEIIKAEIIESKLIGIHLYGLKKAKEVVNLSRLRAINSGLKENQNCALFVGFNFPRKLPRKFENVNSSFVYSTFGIDVFSPNQMSPAQMKAMLQNKEKLTELSSWLYDPTQGGYSTNPDQEAWHGFGLVNTLTHMVPVAEMLNKFQTIIWFSIKLEQDDFDILNEKILSKSDIVKYIKDGKSKWATFWDKFGSEAIG